MIYKVSDKRLRSDRERDVETLRIRAVQSCAEEARPPGQQLPTPRILQIKRLTHSEYMFRKL